MDDPALPSSGGPDASISPLRSRLQWLAHRWEAVLLVLMVAAIGWMTWALLCPPPRAVIRLEPYRTASVEVANDNTTRGSVRQEVISGDDPVKSLSKSLPESREYENSVDENTEADAFNSPASGSAAVSARSGFAAETGEATEERHHHRKRHAWHWRHRHGGAKGKHPGVTSLNTATAAQLEQLPGVGAKTARRILEYRAGHGRFSTVEEIMEVKGIGPKKFEKMKVYLKL